MDWRTNARRSSKKGGAREIQTFTGSIFFNLERRCRNTIQNRRDVCMKSWSCYEEVTGLPPNSDSDWLGIEKCIG
jgi:hypothetical protein